MPTYIYRCEKCQVEFEATHSYKEKINECQCGGLVSKVICPPIVASVKDIKTIGQLAEKNSKKMGKYKLSELRDKDIESKGGIEKVKRNERIKKIGRMTAKQKVKYLEDGSI